MSYGDRSTARSGKVGGGGKLVSTQGSSSGPGMTTRRKKVKNIGRRAHLHFCGECGLRLKDCTCEK